MRTIQWFLFLFAILLSIIVTRAFPIPSITRDSRISRISTRIHSSTEAENNDTNLEWLSSELVNEPDQLEEIDWMPDRDKAKILRQQATTATTANANANSNANGRLTPTLMEDDPKPPRSPYTDEEEDLIEAMGGRFQSQKREPGFLGDCTLKEIATDFSVPVCYIADVLCVWGVPVPININDRLGDLVTGEQAFSMLEAIHSLDVADLQDRYSNDSLVTICDWYEIDLKEAFQMAMKEGWSLPFGVQTFLRVEQEEEMIRVLG